MKYNGAQQDPRSEIEKTKDYQHSELFGAYSPVVWAEKTTFNQGTIRNQDGSGSCGGFSAAVALGMNEKNDNGVYVNLSPAYIYKLRTNVGEGMYMPDLFNIMVKNGSPRDTLLSSDNLNEEQINSMVFTDEQKKEALLFKGMNYLTVSKDIHSIAEVISKGHTPIILLRCQVEEWTEYPKVLYPEKTTSFNVNHFVPAVDFTLINGKQHIVVQDSWGSQYGKNGLRFLSEEFIKVRVETVMYIIDLPTRKKSTVRPQYAFRNVMSFGMKNRDIQMLQRVLQYEGFFPSEIAVTGYFGSVTAKALVKWQVKQGILHFINEQDMRKVRAGALTIAKLNELYENIL